MSFLDAINWQSFLFLLFAITACLFALGTLLSTNIVRMAFYLVLSLGATSGLFFLAGAHFVGAMQLMIYVGGTMVVLIFGVMLTAQERFVSMRPDGGQWVLGIFVGATLLVLLVHTAMLVTEWHAPPEGHLDKLAEISSDEQTTAQLGHGLAGARVDRLDEENPALRRGMSGYHLPFVIVSVHLLVVLVGSAYMARAKRPATSRAESTARRREEGDA